MKKNILFSIILITFFSFPLIDTNAESQNGWVKENGETYYYENGEKVEKDNQQMELTAADIEKILKEKNCTLMLTWDEQSLKEK